MKKVLSLLLSAVMIISLAGCSALSLEPEDILSLPNASGDESEIISLISSSYSSYEPVYPLSGENKNAVIIGDIDQDDLREAVAIFRKPDDPGSITLLFAREQNGRFVSMGESVIQTNLIDRVDFVDIDSDQTEEILIGYQGASSALRSVAIYEIGDEITVTDVPSVYNALIYDDFNADGNIEALCIRLSNDSDISKACLMGYDEALGLSELSSCEIDSDTASVKNLISGGISEGIHGAVLDCETEDGIISTQVFYYYEQQKTLLNPLFVYGGYSDTKRSVPILSADIDSDGVIEIPEIGLMPHLDDEKDETVCSMISWQNYDFSMMALSEKSSAILCPDPVFTLAIDGAKEGRVTARYEKDERTARVYEWESSDGKGHIGNELFYIRAYSKAEYNKDRINEVILCEMNEDIYTYLIEDADSLLSFSGEEIENNFALIK